MSALGGCGAAGADGWGRWNRAADPRRPRPPVLAAGPGSASPTGWAHGLVRQAWGLGWPGLVVGAAQAPVVIELGAGISFMGQLAVDRNQDVGAALPVEDTSSLTCP
jgi:hypothetical protein